MMVCVSCATNPVTGRKQLNLVPGSTLNSMSAQEYDKFLSENKLSDEAEKAQMVQRVGRNIQAAVEAYFAERNESEKLQGYAWQFNLVEDDAQNAWCMPGGRVVVYTGILPVTRDETGLAVVMGHEIAHAVAEHGNERMSTGLITDLAGMALSEALAEKPAETRNLFLNVYGVGTQVGFELPYSRLQEAEADHMGLIFMAMAGYDPRKAVDFWGRMASMSQGASPPEFLSTHPAHQTRIEKIEENMPEAMEYYEKSKSD
jgi:predicted Zn-dependent protease